MTGGEPVYVGPVRTYCVVFQSERSGVAETSICPTHLMFATPTQPGTTSRTGKPWSSGSGWPFIS